MNWSERYGVDMPAEESAPVTPANSKMMGRKTGENTVRKKKKEYPNVSKDLMKKLILDAQREPDWSTVFEILQLGNVTPAKPFAHARHA